MLIVPLLITKNAHFNLIEGLSCSHIWPPKTSRETVYHNWWVMKDFAYVMVRQP
jgi:hypothetical protein